MRYNRKLFSDSHEDRKVLDSLPKAYQFNLQNQKPKTNQ